ncbi:MAG: 16S rRNA (cytosine(1402)-N(4))-methyltransferase RsmH [Minisyncoccota bacterium]
MKVTKHQSVLLQEAVDALHLKPGAAVVDATLGGGGHMREILRRVLPGGRVIAVDADTEAIARVRSSAVSDEMVRDALADQSLVLVHGNYSHLGGVLEQEGYKSVDAILADLGFSSDQIEDAERGLSFLHAGPLDMRLDQGTKLTAYTIVNTWTPEKIAQVLREYGDEHEAWRIACAIEKARDIQPLATTHQLRDVVEAVYPKGKRRQMRIHPATKTFQALRIAVNQEFEHLETFLAEAVTHLKVGGRLAIITFHSGEDARVKQFFKNKAQGCICPPEFPVCRCYRTPEIRLINKKPLTAPSTEITQNPRARSAKLRIIEKL